MTEKKITLNFISKFILFDCGGEFFGDWGFFLNHNKNHKAKAFFKDLFSVFFFITKIIT